MPPPASSSGQARLPGVTFVHVSDIHFHFMRSANSLDRDADIAHQLILDAGRLAAELGGCDGVLVNGDLAFGGKAEEYDLATTWLGQLCDAIRCNPLAVWVVPGNHDVQRPTPPAIRDTLIANLRAPESRGRINDILRGHLESEDGESVLFKCLQRYNEFAGRYGCPVQAKEPSWHHDLPLGDGTVLRLHGLTSVIMSNSDDDDGANKVALGEFQVAMLREDPAVAHLVMCHHPPNWLLDAGDIEPQLNARARIQLFGHEHRQQLNKIDNSLRMLAGAASPPREADHWEPRYNFLSVTVSYEKARKLLVTVYPRSWDPTRRTFVEAAGGAKREFQLDLPQLILAVATTPSGPKMASEGASSTPPPDGLAQAPPAARITMSPERRLTYRFFQLPYAVRLQVVAKFELNADQDQGVTDPELTRRFFERARQRRLLGQLWDELRIRLGLPAEPNPFDEVAQGGGTHA